MFKEEMEQYGIGEMIIAKKVLDDLQIYVTKEKEKWQVVAGDLLGRMEKANKNNKEK